MSLVVGVTGGIGSGKSTVAELLQAQGAAVIDTDHIAHELTAPGGAAIGAIVAAFGAEFINPQGAMDRVRMRQLAFSDNSAKSRLEQILHPLIRQQVEHQLRQAQGCYTLLLVPLLVETDAYRQLIDRTLVVDLPEEQQISRTMARSGLREAEVKAIMARQACRRDRLQSADDVVSNAADLKSLQQQLEALHQRYVALAREAKSNEHAADHL
ncbi:MAG: dephospho-CoA kinase [Neisseriaceae bacterium]|jgi:dephospho-CoA kinase|nr:MAG: dephospho-CoA kinase [Neisseriaceae bacterium]